MCTISGIMENALYNSRNAKELVIKILARDIFGNEMFHFTPPNTIDYHFVVLSKDGHMVTCTLIRN